MQKLKEKRTKMIQIVINDTILKRFTDKIPDIIIHDGVEYTKDDITFEKTLEKDEVKKKLVKQGKDWVFITPPPPGKNIEYLKDKMISLRMKIEAGKIELFDMTSEEELLAQYRAELEAVMK